MKKPYTPGDAVTLLDGTAGVLDQEIYPGVWVVNLCEPEYPEPGPPIMKRVVQEQDLETIENVNV